MPSKKIDFEVTIHPDVTQRAAPKSLSAHSLFRILEYINSDSVIHVDSDHGDIPGLPRSKRPISQEAADAYVAELEEAHRREQAATEGMPVFITRELSPAQAQRIVDVLNYVNQRALDNGWSREEYDRSMAPPIFLKTREDSPYVEIWVRSSPNNALATYGNETSATGILSAMKTLINFRANGDGILYSPFNGRSDPDVYYTLSKNDKTGEKLKAMLPALLAFHRIREPLTINEKFCMSGWNAGKTLLTVNNPNIFNTLMEKEREALKKDGPFDSHKLNPSRGRA